MTSDNSDQWLVRTAENRISGPYTRYQVCQLIQQGKLQLNDEVCHANTYWFYLHEHEEIKNQLGIELPRELYKDAEEPTQTETDTEIDPTDPAFEIRGGTRVAAMGTSGATRGAVRPPKEADIPELSQSIEDIGENTAVMSNRAFRDFRQQKPVPTGAPGPAPAPMPLNGLTPVSHGGGTTPISTQPGSVHVVTPEHPVVPPAPGKKLGWEKSRLVQIATYLMMFGAVVLLIFVIRLLQQQPNG